MSDGWGARTHSWLGKKPTPALVRQIQRVARLPNVDRLAVLGDAHEGRTVPNGVVTATRQCWYPELTGTDVGCGVAAIAFDGSWSLSGDDGLRFLGDLAQAVPTFKHLDLRRVSPLPEACNPDDLEDPRLVQVARRDGRWEFGTLGRGNHFIELACDSAGRLWALVHSGSRILGPTLLKTYSEGAFHPLDSDGHRGRSWFKDAQWLVRYASESRMAILNRVADLVERRGGPPPDEGTYIDCPHNFPRVEIYNGEAFCIHRKSVNSAAKDEVGIIPGSMASGSRIVRGLGKDEALRSSSHGAGRVLGRREAFERLKLKDFEGIMGRIHYRREAARELLDEAPQAYRNLDEVMGLQSDLVKTTARLLPILNDKRP